MSEQDPFSYCRPCRWFVPYARGLVHEPDRKEMEGLSVGDASCLMGDDTTPVVILRVFKFCPYKTEPL